MINTILKKMRNNDVIAMLIFFCCALFVIRLILLFSSLFAFGADGYYYAAQIRYYFGKGHFFAPDSSIFLYFLTYFSLLWDNPVVSNKVAVALTTVGITIVGYRLGKNLYGGKGGVFLAGLLSANSLLSFFVFDYVKNLGGVFFFIIFLNQVYNVLKDNATNKELIKLAVAFFLVFFSHKLMAGFASGVMLAVLLYVYRNKKKVVAAGTVIILCAVAAAGIIFPNSISFADFVRFRDLFSLTPQFSVLSFVHANNLPPAFAVEAVVFFISPLACFFAWKRFSRAQKVFISIMLIFFFVINNPFFRFGQDDFAYRIFLLIFIPGSVFLALLAFTWSKYIPIVFCAALLPYAWYTGNVIKSSSQYDYALYNDLLSLINLPDDSLLIAHIGFDYFYCYNGKGDAFHFLPEEKHRGKKLYRLAHGVNPDRFAGLVKDGSGVQFIPGGYSVMREDQWNSYINKINSIELKRLMTWKNPHSHREVYMKKNDRFLENNGK